MINWTAQEIVLDLKYTWKISRNATDQKKNLIVRISDGTFEGSGEAAPNIRYQETPEQLLLQVELFINAIRGRELSFEVLIEYFL